MSRGRAFLAAAAIITILLAPETAAWAQDASTGAICGTVFDPTGFRVANAGITVVNRATGAQRQTVASPEGEFALEMLTPGTYELQVNAPKFAPWTTSGIIVEVGGKAVLDCRLALPHQRETLVVTADAQAVEPLTPAVSSVIDEKAIAGLPLNGRRFTDLALLTPGITQDPRSLTSGSNGDLAFGGLRGAHTSYVVDGADNNNSFFGQARGRYRAPYQFSNEVIQEFRVSSNTYGAEMGRSAGAVVNVVTKSGGNYSHGTAFRFVRDSKFNAQDPFTDFKAGARQDQFGGTIGGPIKKNRVFYYAGFDQQIFHVPIVVRFEKRNPPYGTSQLTNVTPVYSVVPTVTPSRYDSEAGVDDKLVAKAAAQLSAMGGTYPSALIGNAAFLKLDYILSPRNQLSARLNTSRYWGTNNVFFDPASPITLYTISNNGEEEVATESAVVSLTSALSFRTTSHLRLQFSRDLQQSWANSQQPGTVITDITKGFGKSYLLPRATREHKLHLAETVSREHRRHTFKFGGDFAPAWIYDYFPGILGGKYTFSDIKVNHRCLANPLYCQPQYSGVSLTPLRAYAHELPRYYSQSFGNAVSHPDSTDFALFAQNEIRATDHLALTLGIRWDLQTFRSDGLVSNPLWPDAGKMPLNSHNFAPRLGFAYSLGESHPLIIRGGYGWFYARIPQIFNSAVETQNGVTNSSVSLDQGGIHYGPHDLVREVFPTYPAPLVNCVGAIVCTPPASLVASDPGAFSSNVAAFGKDFHTPMSQQASFSIEREIAGEFSVGISYLYVHGEHLIRARDVNLPPPVLVSYPISTDNGTTFLDQYYQVESFSPWDRSCPYGGICIGDLVRPISQLGTIKVFESAASSTYNGLTVSIRRRMSRGVYFRAAFTWAKAIDNFQDAPVTGAAALVQNSYNPAAERGLSTTDQRHRFVLAWVYEPHPFHREHEQLRRLFNDWRISGVTTIGSGRPFSATVTGDPSGDGNYDNYRLPGVSRNSLTGPGYATTDLRLSRSFELHERWNLELIAESFNLLNRDNKRMDITDNGFQTAAAAFVPYSVKVNGVRYPAYFSQNSGFQQPSSAYAPRQLQFALRMRF